MRKRIEKKYTTGEIGRVRVIEDFLPSPEPVGWVRAAIGIGKFEQVEPRATQQCLRPHCWVTRGIKSSVKCQGAQAALTQPTFY
jgi:hypothetical protein